MKVKLTNGKIFDIVYVLKNKYPDLTQYDKRFNFAISRTLAELEPIASDILKARSSGIPAYNEFEQRKASIIKKYAKVENNVPKFNTPEDQSQAQIEVNQLAVEYDTALKERTKEMQIYNEILEQEVEVDIIPCKFEALPSNFDFNLLRVLVKETDEEIEALL